MQIFEALRQDHDKQRALMDVIVDTKGDSAVRAEFFTQLKAELQNHAIAEERYFYSPLIQKDATVELSRHGIAEHHQIDKLIEDLENISIESGTWLKTMKELRHKVLQHLEEEENDFFQKAGRALDAEEKADLADQYINEMQDV
jgi:ElaB/YqjD/DUF883 family membrane-anchored ribosome-binding protein